LESARRIPFHGRSESLGWVLRVDFDEGISQTIEYFRGCLERGELGDCLQVQTARFENHKPSSGFAGVSDHVRSLEEIMALLLN
jgi:hypothetical protein